MNELALQLQGYRMTTAEILYHLPERPGLLQTFIWQFMDQAPRFPRLNKFLDFWHREIDGILHSVKIANAELVKPAELVYCSGEFRLH
ncbi:MAG: Usg family protein [Rhodospirillaceae bacterium]|nr:Usg family protein [Rhodospirillaceae bacterium]